MTILYTVLSRAKDAVILIDVADKDIKNNANSNLNILFQQMLQYFVEHPNTFFTIDGEMRTFRNKNQSAAASCGGPFGGLDSFDFLSYFVEACTTVMGDSTQYLNDNILMNEETKTPSNTNYNKMTDTKTVVVPPPSTSLKSSTTNNNKNTNEESLLEYEPEDYYIHVYMVDGIFYSCLSDEPDVREQKV